MCLIKTHKYPRISSKPIKVYKTLIIRNGKYRTPFRDIEVELGDVIKSKIPFILGIFSHIIEGEGVHAFSTPITLCQNEVLVEAEIPPYTPYWIGENSEIAAGRLKLIKVIDSYELY